MSELRLKSEDTPIQVVLCTPSGEVIDPNTVSNLTAKAVNTHTGLAVHAWTVDGANDDTKLHLTTEAVYMRIPDAVTATLQGKVSLRIQVSCDALVPEFGDSPMRIVAQGDLVQYLEGYHDA